MANNRRNQQGGQQQGQQPAGNQPTTAAQQTAAPATPPTATTIEARILVSRPDDKDHPTELRHTVQVVIKDQNGKPIGSNFTLDDGAPRTENAPSGQFTQVFTVTAADGETTYVFALTNGASAALTLPAPPKPKHHGHPVVEFLKGLLGG